MLFVIIMLASLFFFFDRFYNNILIINTTLNIWFNRMERKKNLDFDQYQNKKSAKNHEISFLEDEEIRNNF